MPKLVVATGVAASPTLEIAEVEVDDYTWWVTFWSGKFRIWVQQEKIDNRYNKMYYVALKCSLNNKQVTKIEKAKNAQGEIDEATYTYPQLPPVETRDPLHLLYSSYDINLGDQLNLDPCTAAAIARYKLLLAGGRKLSETISSQIFSTPQGDKSLQEFLLQNHCYLVDSSTDRRVQYSVKNQSVTSETNQCVYGAAQNFKAPVAGLVGVENIEDYRLLNVAIARW